MFVVDYQTLNFAHWVQLLRLFGNLCSVVVNNIRHPTNIDFLSGAQMSYFIECIKSKFDVHIVPIQNGLFFIKFLPLYEKSSTWLPIPNNN